MIYNAPVFSLLRYGWGHILCVSCAENHLSHFNWLAEADFHFLFFFFLDLAETFMADMSLAEMSLAELRTPTCSRGESTNYVISLCVHKSFGTQF